MTELATIFQDFGAQYKEEARLKIPDRHRKALSDIANCRTEAMGGRVYQCSKCDNVRYSYHSCRNRHCPKCQHNAGQRWLQKQHQLLLPTPYFMLTFTLPQEFRQVAQTNQKAIYDLLFRASAQATQELARDPRLLGGQIGMIGILHTWTRDLAYHPHIHYLVPAGAWETQNGQWLPAKPKFFLPIKPLAKLFKGKFKEGLRQLSLLQQTTQSPWQKKWVVHSQSVGTGKAALNYLAPYIFRVAISNKRILNTDEEKVTFRYTASATGQTKQATFPAIQFMRRFLQHVLPKGFVKIRYYGFLAPGKRNLLKRIRLALGLKRVNKTPQAKPYSADKVSTCPTCGQQMPLIQRLFPLPRLPPAHSLWN